jgi:hypothetical protein
MELRLPRLLITADLPDTLTGLGGISPLERLRCSGRILGFREATILSNSVEAVAAHLAEASWHATDVASQFRERTNADVTGGEVNNCLATMNASHRKRLLVIFGNCYCDVRLLRALAKAQRDSVLIDSDPPVVVAPLWKGRAQVFCAALLSSEWLSGKDRDRSLMEEFAADLGYGDRRDPHLSRCADSIVDLTRSEADLAD